VPSVSAENTKGVIVAEGTRAKLLVLCLFTPTCVSYYYYYAAFYAPCVGHKDDESQARMTNCRVGIDS